MASIKQPPTHDIVEIHRKITKDTIITKSLDVAQAKFRPVMTLVMKRLFHAILAIISPEDKPFTAYMLNLNELAKQCRLPPNKCQEQIRAITEKMVGTAIVFRPGNHTGIKETQVPMLAQCDYLDGGWVRILISPGMFGLFIGIKKEFDILYPANVPLQFKKLYSFAMLDLLNQFIGQGDIEISPDDLRVELDVDPGKYEDFHHLRQRVIEPAIEEINECTWLQASFRLKMQGKKCLAVVLNVDMKPGNTHPMAPKPAIEQLSLSLGLVIPPTEDIAARMEKHGFERPVIARLLTKYPAERVWDNILYVEGMKRVANFPAYAHHAIKEDLAAKQRENSLLKKKESKARAAHIAQELYDQAALETADREDDIGDVDVEAFFAKVRAHNSKGSTGGPLRSTGIL